MRYKSVSESTCREHVKKRLAGRHTSLQGVAQGTGERCVDYPKIRSAAEWMKRQIDEADPKDRDRTEGRLAVRLFQALADVDPAVLDDDGFWRYLALRHFWDVVAWRQPDAFAGPESSETAITYVDAKKPTESVLTRMYLQAVAAGMNGDAQDGESESKAVHALEAEALEKARDFWRSHVIRVRTGTAPSLVRAFVRRQQRERMNTAPLREFAKAVNRTWTNVLLSEYDEEEAAALLDELAHDLQGSSSEADEESPEREQP